MPGRTPRDRTGRRAANGHRLRRGPACGDGWSRAGRGEGDLWCQGASSIDRAGQVRGNQYFRWILGEYEVPLGKRDICYNKEGRVA